MELAILGASIVGILLFINASWYVQLLLLSGVLVAYIMRPPHVKGNPPRSVPYGTAKNNETVPRRSPYSRDLVHTCLGCETVPEMFRKAIDEHGKKPFMGMREFVTMKDEKREVKKDGKTTTKVFQIPVLKPYTWTTYKQVGNKVERLSSGLIKAGLKPRDRLAIFANTRPEWMMMAQAALAQNITVVTVYATLGVNALVHSFQETEVTHVVTEASLLGTLTEVLESKQVTKLNTVICIDKAEQKSIDKAKKIQPGLNIITYDELLKKGNPDDVCNDPPTKNDLAIIMYTSGSTGNPKGVMVSHQNFVSLVGAVNLLISNTMDMKDSVWLAYLPLAHILELASEVFMLAIGAKVGYSSPRTLMDDAVYDETGKGSGDIRALSPTMMPAVPLVLDRIRAGIEAKIAKAGLVVRLLFKVAYYMKKKNWLEGNESPLWDKLVFAKVQAAFGGSLKGFLSGGAPLSAATQEFVNVVIGCPVMQGYGLTETCAAGTITHPEDRVFGRVGGPFPCNEFKLVDCPEMGYTNKDTDGEGMAYPRGEVWFRGYNVTEGYFRLSEKTSESYVPSEDGSELKWFKTGDIAKLHPDGTLEIIDRMKDLVKLVHGEYIALGSLESIFRGSQFVENIAVHGDSHQAAPVALLAPNETNLKKWAKEHDISEADDLEALCKNATVKKAVMDDLTALGTSSKIQKCEYPADIFICHEPWTPENGMLTTAMKLKRTDVYAKYKKEIQAMYSK